MPAGPTCVGESYTDGTGRSDPIQRRLPSCAANGDEPHPVDNAARNPVLNRPRTWRKSAVTDDRDTAEAASPTEAPCQRLWETLSLPLRATRFGLQSAAAVTAPMPTGL